MNTTMMIEPCCCDRQAPSALKANGGHTTLFTNGDVTLQNWFNALSSLAGSNHRMTLLVADPDVQMLRWLRNWLNRGWTTHLQLTTRVEKNLFIERELEGLMDRVSVAVDPNLQSELVVFEGDRGVVVICGPMLSEKQPGLIVYSAYNGKNAGVMAELISAANARHRQHKVELKKENSEEETNKEEQETASIPAAEQEAETTIVADAVPVEGEGAPVRKQRKAKKADDTPAISDAPTE